MLLRSQVATRQLAQPFLATGGALVVDRTLGEGRASFTPGHAAELRSRDGRVSVRLPANVHARRLTFQHSALADQLPTLIAQGAPIPPDVAGFKRGLDPFVLDARDDRGGDVHLFAAPFTLSVSYTPEQLQARSISEADLTLYWFDPSRHMWTPIPTQIDQATHTASAAVDHFSGFMLGDGSSPSAAYVPSLQGWQVVLYSGNASFSYPIDVPAGPAGLKPSLTMSYNSTATDGMAGTRLLQQASWLGRGWSLDTGSISLNKVVYTNYGSSFSHYTMISTGSRSI